jgi:hypothetical protein
VSGLTCFDFSVGRSYVHSTFGVVTLRRAYALLGYFEAETLAGAVVLVLAARLAPGEVAR